MRVGHHRAQPLFLNQRGLQPLSLALEREPVFESCPMMAAFREPTEFPFVARKENRTTDAVSNGIRIAIREIGTTLALFIPDKRDRTIVRSEGGTRQYETKHRMVEGFTQCCSPMPAVGRMMQLVENDKGGSPLAASPEYVRGQGHLLICDHRPMVVRSLAHLFVCQRRSEMHTDCCCRIGP